MSSWGNVIFAARCTLIIQALCKHKAIWHYSLQTWILGDWVLLQAPLSSFVCFISFTGRNGIVCSLVLGKEKWYLFLDSQKDPRLRKGQETLSWNINRNRSNTKCHLPQSSNYKLLLPRVCCNISRNIMRPVLHILSLGKVIFPAIFATFGLNSCTLQNLFQIITVDIYHKSKLWSLFSSLKYLKKYHALPLA